jgi:hypothetical protein
MTAVLQGTLAQHWSFPTAIAWDDSSEPIAATSGAFLMARMSLNRETPPFACGEEFVKSIPQIQRFSRQEILSVQLNNFEIENDSRAWRRGKFQGLATISSWLISSLQPFLSASGTNFGISPALSA